MVVLASCGEGQPAQVGQSTPTTTTGSAARATSVTASDVTSTSETAPLIAEAAVACAEAGPLAETFLDLVQWEAGDWRLIAGESVGGDEAVDLLDHLSEDITVIEEDLASMTPVSPQVVAMVSESRALVQALLETLELLRNQYANGASIPLDDDQVAESVLRATVMFEDMALTLIEWLDANCPELSQHVSQGIDEVSE